MKLASIFFTASAGNLRVCLNIFITTTYKTADVMLKMRKRNDKRAFLVKSQQKRLTHFTFGSASCLYVG